MLVKYLRPNSTQDLWDILTTKTTKLLISLEMYRLPTGHT